MIVLMHGDHFHFLRCHNIQGLWGKEYPLHGDQVHLLVGQ